jgi:hypothetical protein
VTSAWQMPPKLLRACIAGLFSGKSARHEP